MLGFDRRFDDDAPSTPRLICPMLGFDRRFDEAPPTPPNMPDAGVRYGFHEAPPTPLMPTRGITTFQSAPFPLP